MWIWKASWHKLWHQPVFKARYWFLLIVNAGLGKHWIKELFKLASRFKPLKILKLCCPFQCKKTFLKNRYFYFCFRIFSTWSNRFWFLSSRAIESFFTEKGLNNFLSVSHHDWNCNFLKNFLVSLWFFLVFWCLL